jgi:dTDP-4-amino-4,6-dideoxygalactose transaminase
MRDWGAEKKYEHSTWGGNFRLESLQASFLSTKLEHLELWTTERKNIAAIYQKTINPEHQMETVSKKGSHVFHIFALNVINRNQATKILDDKGISFGFHYPTAIHQNLAFRSRVKIRVKLSQSEKLSKETLSLPIFPKMTQEEIGRVLDAVACFSKK